MAEALRGRAVTDNYGVDQDGRTFTERDAADKAALAAFQAARPDETAELVAAVRKYAQGAYDQGGWDVVVECWTDADIAQAMVFYGYSDGIPYAVTNLAEAVRDSVLAQVVGVWADRQADAENSRF